MDAFADVVQLLQSESERLKQYLHALPSETWGQPSACTQWQVQDVVAHLAGVAEFYAGMVSRGLQGNASPPEGRPSPGTVNAAAVSEGLAQRTIASRVRLGNQLLATFSATNDHL